MRLWLLTLMIATTFAGIGDRHCALADENSPQQPPIVVEPGTAEQPAVVRLNAVTQGNADPLQIGEFTLTDMNGEVFHSKELAGHPWVAAFIFTRCMGYCPKLVRDLRLEVADRVDDPDVRFVVISVDPDVDTPQRLKQYAEVYVTDFERWRFLTGDKAEIYKLVRHGFRLTIDQAQGPDVRPGFEVAHSLSLIHVDPDGRVIGKYDSRDEQQVLALRRVLNGAIETPPESRVIAASDSTDDAVDLDARAVEQLQTTRPPQAAGGERVGQLPPWAARLPATNAMLNGLATLLLMAGFIAIKRGHIIIHKRLMLLAFGTSVVFLGCYLTYHFALHQYTGTHGKPFEGTGAVRTAYFALLISHVLLAMSVPVLAVITIYRGLKEQWAAHRRIAGVTFPIWLYVSITGVIIYGMLYHWPG